MSVGVIALDLGLEVWEALVAVVLGTSLFRRGRRRPGSADVRIEEIPTLTFTRAAFGPRGNLVNAVLTWAALVAFGAINGIFGVYALLELKPPSWAGRTRAPPATC